MKSVVRFSSAVIALAVSGSAMAAEPVVLKIEPWRRAVAIRAEVGGKERLFQFDTGGGITIISPALAKELAAVRFGA